MNQYKIYTQIDNYHKEFDSEKDNAKKLNWDSDV